MPDDASLVPDPPEAKDVTVDAHPLAVFESSTPMPLDPEMLIQGLRYLQQRIPDFQQLSAREKQRMLRAANLDPAFVDVGIQTAEAWNEPKIVIGYTGEELRHETAEAQRWDEVERELRVLTEGVAAANLKRKYRIGNAVLMIYHLLKAGGREHLKPYRDDMERAYMRRRRRPRKAEPEPEPE